MSYEPQSAFAVRGRTKFSQQLQQGPKRHARQIVATAIGIIAVVFLVQLLTQSGNKNHGLELERISRTKIDGLELPLHWQSFRKWEATSKPMRSLTEPEDVHVEGHFLSHDEIVLSDVDLEATLATLERSPEEGTVWLGFDAGLVMRWDVKSKQVTFETGEQLTQSKARLSAVASWERPWPTTAALKEVRLKIGPEERMWWAAPGSLTASDETTSQIGLGFAGILRDGRGYFTPHGSRIKGPDRSSEAWLNIGKDAQGNYYFWYSKD